MIINIDSRKRIELVNVCFSYLYPYLVRFCVKNEIGIEWMNSEIRIPISLKDDFITLLKKALDELLSECYREPTQKQRGKYPSRFEKKIVDGKVYILNYRTDIIGLVSYALIYLIDEISSLSD